MAEKERGGNLEMSLDHFTGTKLVVVRREDRNEKHGSVTLYFAI